MRRRFTRPRTKRSVYYIRKEYRAKNGVEFAEGDEHRFSCRRLSVVWRGRTFGVLAGHIEPWNCPLCGDRGFIPERDPNLEPNPRLCPNRCRVRAAS